MTEDGSNPLLRFRPPRGSPLAKDLQSDHHSKKRRRTEDIPLPPELFSRLKDFALFEDAPEPFLLALGRALRLIQYRPKEYIVKYGDPAKSMYWILRGTVAVTSADSEAVYAELAPGSFFGEIGILFNRPRTATVVASTRVLLGVLTKESLEQVLGGFPSMERLIRDEGQERLAMQQKRKASSGPKTFQTSMQIQRRSITNHSGNYNDTPYNSSLLAAVSAQLPGPSCPPVLTYVAGRETDSLPQWVPTTPGKLPHYYRLPSFVENPTKPASFSAMPALKLEHIFRPSVSAPLDAIDNSISTRGFLCSLPIFEKLPQNMFHELALSCDLKSLKPTEYIVHKGDRGRDIFFVVTGEVEVINPDDHSNVLARLGPTKYFGEMAFAASLNSTEKSTRADVRSADVRAVTECEILVVHSKDLDEICSRYPSVCEDMRRTAAQRLRDNDSVGDLIQTYGIGDRDKITVASLIAKGNNVSVLPSPDQNTSHFSGFDGFSFKEKKLSATIEIAPDEGRSSDEEYRPKTKRRRSPSIQMSMPPMNPSYGSIDRFNAPLYRNEFQYHSRDQRRRLSTVSGTRRRSSLVSHGPFPDTIMLKIFQYLDLPCLMRISRVCRRWKQIIYLSPNLFKTLDLRPWSKDLTDQTLQHITDFVGPRPSVIDVSNCYHITDNSFSYLINEVGIRGHIKELRMHDDWNISAMAIMDLSVAAPELEKIDLGNCRKVRDDVIERLVSSSESKFGCNNLSELNLAYCKYLTDRTMLLLAKHANERLVSLDLTRCTTISDNGYCFWAETSFSRMKKLVLRDCTFITDNAISSVATSCPYLERLDLTFCCLLTDNTLAILYLFCKHLKHLNLSFCGSAVSDNSMLSLTKMKKLEELIVTGCVRVTREGVDSIVSHCEKMRLLDLSQCGRINYYRDKLVPAFTKIKGTRFTHLQVAPHGRVIKVII